MPPLPLSCLPFLSPNYKVSYTGSSPCPPRPWRPHLRVGQGRDMNIWSGFLSSSVNSGDMKNKTVDFLRQLLHFIIFSWGRITKPRRENIVHLWEASGVTTAWWTPSLASGWLHEELWHVWSSLTLLGSPKLPAQQEHKESGCFQVSQASQVSCFLCSFQGLCCEAREQIVLQEHYAK